MKPDYDFSKKEVYVSKKFSFSAAHQINDFNHEQLHGHNYTVKVTLKGTLNNDGILIDINKLESLIYTHVIYPLDHSFLNEQLKPLNPTVEVLTLYLFNKIETCLRICQYTTNLKIDEITVYETDSYSATIKGSS